MNPLAGELNRLLETTCPHVYAMLSDMGRQLFFPKGILSQGAEAREKAHRINATIGIATEEGHIMRMESIMASIQDLAARESLTYAPSFGIPALREAWREELVAKNPSLDGKQISLPVVTGGITHAVSLAADLWIDAGDPVLLPDMMWGNYNLIFNVRHGARIVNYPLFDRNGGLDTHGFEAAVQDTARNSSKVVVVLNFPQNPSGYTLTENEADSVVDILVTAARAGTNIVALTDDAYFGLFYESESIRESLFSRLCGTDPRLLAIKLDGATKENFAWGLRVGFITYGAGGGMGAAAYEALEKKTAGAVRGNISNASHLGQSIVLRSMHDQRYAAEKNEKFEVLRRRAARVKEVLNDPRFQEAWEPYPFNSGYFMCLRLKTVDAERLRVHLLERYGVGLIAIDGHNLRVAFSCLDESDIRELFETILTGIRDLEKSRG